MNRREVLTRLGIVAASAAIPTQRVVQSAQRYVGQPAERAAEAARTLGFRVVEAPVGGPAVQNIWRKLNDTDSVLVGWIYSDGSTVWGAAPLGLVPLP